ncbi:hypothetical protein B296_00030568, partial [Ensete ventricosum]
MSRAGAEPSEERRYKGVRRRRWGKWVSEIRVPGSRERLWLGSFSTPEAAAVAHDTAVFFLHGPGGSRGGFNFPNRVATFAWADLSPPSVQRVASESGMDVDARLAVHAPEAQPRPEVVIHRVCVHISVVSNAADGSSKRRRQPHVGLPRTIDCSRGGRVQKEVAQATASRASGRRHA